MISIIAAIDRDGVIGDSSQNSIPWNCPLDQEIFRARTMQTDIFVGRKTWENLPDKVKENQERDERRFCVLSETLGSKELDNAYGPCESWGEVVNYFECIKRVEYDSYSEKYTLDRSSLQNSFREIASEVDVCFAGGRSVYKEVIEKGLANRAFLSRIPVNSGGDIKWPGLTDDWEKYRERKIRSDVNLYPRKEIKLEEWGYDI